MFRYVVETERRFYLCNEVQQSVHQDGGRTFVELTLHDAWVWDMYRTSRFAPSVRVVSFKDVNVEELPEKEREVLELAYWSGMSQSEVAEYLHIPLGTVKTRTRSALSRLAGVLEGEVE